MKIKSKFRNCLQDVSTQYIFVTILMLFQLSWAIVPSTVTIGVVVDQKDVLYQTVAKYTVDEINKDMTTLPNTTLQTINVSLSANTAQRDIMQLSQSDTAALFEATPPQIPSEVAANILNTTTTTLGRFICDPLYEVDDYSMCGYSISLDQNLLTINKAVDGILTSINVTNAVIVYDVLRSKQVSNFLDLTKNTLKKYQLVYLNFDEASELNSHSLQDLRNLHSWKIYTVILFVEPGNTELIMDIVNMQCVSSTVKESLLWILPRVNSTEFNANPLDKVIALRLKIDRGASYKHLLDGIRHSTEYMKYDLPESAALLHDAIKLTAKAIHNVVSQGQWISQNDIAYNGLFLNQTTNGGNVKNAMYEVKIKGLTGNVALNTNGLRNKTELEILNLRKNKFFQIGAFSTTSGITINEKVQVNRPLPETPIAHKTLRVVAMQQEPFVYITNKGNNTYEYSGYSYDLLKKLSEMLHFKIKIHKAKANTISSILQELKDEKADIALNSVIVSASRQRKLSFTKPFMHFSVGLLVRIKEEKDLDLTQFMLPFTIPAWTLLLGSCLVVTVIVYLVDKYSPYGWRQVQQAQGEEGDEFSLFNSLWFCTACIMTQGADNTPRNLSGRILAGCFWFCVLIWNATYTANLASFLVLKNNQLPVSSLEDAVVKKYDMVLVKDSAIAKIIEVSKNSVHEKIRSNVHFVNTHKDAVDLLKMKQGRAFIAEEPFLNYFKGRKVCNLAMMKNVLQPMSFAFGLPIGSKYTHSMSLGILRLQEQGFTDSIERKWWEYQNQCPKTTQSVSQSRLDVKEMLGVYVVLSAGIVISVIMVAVEIWWRKSLGETVKGFIASKRRQFSRKVDDKSDEKQVDNNDNQVSTVRF